MSDPGAKQHPMSDLQDFETRFGQFGLANQKADEALVELLRIMRGQNEPQRALGEPKSESPAKAQSHKMGLGRLKQPATHQGDLDGDAMAAETGLPGGGRIEAAMLPKCEKPKAEYRVADPRVPLLKDDFAAIEAGLLAGLREQTAASISDAGGAEERLSLQAGPREPQMKSRGPLYATAATVLVALTGIAVSFALETQGPGPSELAAIAPEVAAAPAVAAQTANAETGPAQDAAILDTPHAPAPVAVADKPEQPAEAAQAEEVPPFSAAGSEAVGDHEPAAVAAKAPGQEDMPIEPAASQPATPEKTISDLIQSEAMPLSGGGPSLSGLSHSDVKQAPHPPKHSAAAPTRPTKAANLAKTQKIQKAVASKPGTRALGDEPRPLSAKASVNRVPAPAETAPVAVADSKPEAPAPQPAQTSTGAFGFIQTAMNTITTTTAKLLQWGGIETGPRP